MTEGFSLNPDLLRQSAQALSGFGYHLDAESSKLRAGTTGDGAVWGTDEAGLEFGAAHEEVADLANRAIAAIARGLDELGGALHDTAQDAVETDETHANELKRLLDDLGTSPWQ
ncbi:hypothetical protein OU415_26050 [Saccharopolyspora sp. WRP15-2]|uniref:Excreted virulence factor EspC (Type VII ESX diderm) n=1 Tax=Saccharopolyspora oryzae TaxID=2997343 RepID=A0ABT4V518_9PSEU|nr:hypothetical protein [Saccharopolyspora oryzae]MDA3628923.1 hypothetical protein [Saccharopolyspora oryzae]